MAAAEINCDQRHRQDYTQDDKRKPDTTVATMHVDVISDDIYPIAVSVFALNAEFLAGLGR